MTAGELRELAGAAFVSLALAAAGVLLAWRAEGALGDARRELAAARTELTQGRARLARIAEDEREVREKLPVYRRLRETGALGAERRLDWLEAIARIRARRGLLGLRYRIEPQTLLRSLAGKPAPVDVYASSLHVQLALLHEEDLLRFLADLRESGGALHLPRQCEIRRASEDEIRRGVAARLSADCRIDLITFLDRAAKS